MRKSRISHRAGGGVSIDDFVEMKIGDLTVRIDRTVCAAFKDCIGVAPEVFQLAEDGIVRFENSGEVDRERLIDACSVCPVDALSVFDENGVRIVPG